MRVDSVIDNMFNNRSGKKKVANKRNERRLQNYRKLRSAGFSNKEATKYKDYSKKRIDALIVEREAYNNAIKDIEVG